jgi:hypothetical protein
MSVKNDTLGYFSALITSLAFIPIFAEMVLNDLPECHINPESCSHSKVVYLASGQLYLILFAIIAVCLTWLLLGRLRFGVLGKSKIFADRILPPEDDSGILFSIVGTVLLGGIIITTIFFTFVFSPRFATSIYINLNGNIGSIIISLIFMSIALLSTIAGKHLPLKISLIIGGIYMIISFIPSH